MYILFLASTAAEALSNGNSASTSENATPTTSGIIYFKYYQKKEVFRFELEFLLYYSLVVEF